MKRLGRTLSTGARRLLSCAWLGAALWERVGSLNDGITIPRPSRLRAWRRAPGLWIAGEPAPVGLTDWSRHYYCDSARTVRTVVSLDVQSTNPCAATDFLRRHAGMVRDLVRKDLARGRLTKVPGFTANLLAETCAEVARIVPRAAGGEVYRHAWLEEANGDGLVRMGAGDKALSQAVQCEAKDPDIEFPEYRHVLNSVKGAVRIGINAKYLAEVVSLVGRVSGEVGVVLSVPAEQLGAHIIGDGCTRPGGHWPVVTAREDTGLGHWRYWLRDRKGGAMDEWPDDLRVREWPT